MRGWGHTAATQHFWASRAEWNADMGRYELNGERKKEGQRGEREVERGLGLGTEREGKGGGREGRERERERER